MARRQDHRRRRQPNPPSRAQAQLHDQPQADSSAGWRRSLARGSRGISAEAAAVQKRRGSRSPLDGLVARFGDSHAVALEADDASELAEQIVRLGWADEESLLARRLTWEERQSVVEAAAVVELVSRDSNAAFGSRTPGTKPIVVVDARSLQIRVQHEGCRHARQDDSRGNSCCCCRAHPCSVDEC